MHACAQGSRRRRAHEGEDSSVEAPGSVSGTECAVAAQQVHSPISELPSTPCSAQSMAQQSSRSAQETLDHQNRPQLPGVRAPAQNKAAGIGGDTERRPPPIRVSRSTTPDRAAVGCDRDMRKPGSPPRLQGRTRSDAPQHASNGSFQNGYASQGNGRSATNGRASDIPMSGTTRMRGFEEGSGTVNRVQAWTRDSLQAAKEERARALRGSNGAGGHMRASADSDDTELPPSPPSCPSSYGKPQFEGNIQPAAPAEQASGCFRPSHDAKHEPVTPYYELPAEQPGDVQPQHIRRSQQSYRVADPRQRRMDEERAALYSAPSGASSVRSSATGRDVRTGRSPQRSRPPEVRRAPSAASSVRSSIASRARRAGSPAPSNQGRYNEEGGGHTVLFVQDLDRQNNKTEVGDALPCADHHFDSCSTTCAYSA